MNNIKCKCGGNLYIDYELEVDYIIYAGDHTTYTGYTAECFRCGYKEIFTNEDIQKLILTVLQNKGQAL